MQYPLKSIAYLDDDSNLRTLFKTVLENKRPCCTIHVYAEAESLINFLQHETPDLLILDYSLPDITGVELLKIIRAMPHPSARIPALILSGFIEGNMKDVKDTELLLGVLRKPFSIHGINNDIDFLWQGFHA